MPAVDRRIPKGRHHRVSLHERRPRIVEGWRGAVERIRGGGHASRVSRCANGCMLLHKRIVQ